MKKLLLSATAFLSVAVSLKAQQVIPCGTYEAREYYLKTLPGYAAQLNAKEAALAAEYQAYLQSKSQGGAAAKTSSLSASYQFTVPVVFHILHQGEALGVGANINDADCITALAQVNRDYGHMGSDTTAIDPLFKPLYVNSNMHFQLAQKDPNGNCTTGIIHHYDNNTVWSRDVLNFKYSTYAAGNWNPSKYLNIYIVKNIPGDGAGITVGYTYLPGTSPVLAADAIVYRNDFLTGGDRSLSHEIGHWFGLSHTFGATNSPGNECGNDDIYDTPATTGFFSTCPKPASYWASIPSVTNPNDASDITTVRFGKMYNITAPNSLAGYMRSPLFTMVATTVTPTTDSTSVLAYGTAGSYSDFSRQYGNDFNAGTAGNLISITSTALPTDSNDIAVYIDFNKNGVFENTASERVFAPVAVLGAHTFTTNYTIPSGLYGIYRMRVINSNASIVNASVVPSSGEFEDYNLNIGTSPGTTIMASCDSVRPNIENIMDYSSCPKMFTQGQTDKVRFTAQSNTANRSMLVDTNNLVFTGILNRIITFNTTTQQNDTTYTPSTASPCAPVADFSFNKSTTCEGQAIVYTNTSFNGTGMTYAWEFQGGSPSTSTLAVQSVTYSTPGTYSVSFTATNAHGVSTKTISTITIAWNAPTIALPYAENFDSGTWWPTGWNVPAYSNNIGTPTWELSPYGAGTSVSTPTSAYSLVLPSANSMQYSPPLYQGFAGTVDYIETPAFDFSNVTSPSFSFDYSFARKTGVVSDTFRLQYSLDCGGTWKGMPSMPATSAMAVSGGTVNAPYIPWSSAPTTTVSAYKWKTITVASTFFSGLVQNERSVRFRFWFKNDIETGESQNLYIDNINISGTVGIREFENSIGLSIYPNPSNAASTVEFTSPTSAKANVLVHDVTGRVIEQTDINATAGVVNKHAVNASGKLTAGIYFVSITINNNRVVKKLIIN
ncbi:MAG: M43 family zinc metalloprotease [Bacteroidota bacterium]